MKHLEEQDMSYIEHYFRGIGFAWWCVKMYTICLIHAVFPFWHEDTFSEEVHKLSSKLKEEK